jgi:hypothetical protein
MQEIREFFRREGGDKSVRGEGRCHMRERDVEGEQE